MKRPFSAVFRPLIVRKHLCREILLTQGNIEVDADLTFETGRAAAYRVA